MSLSPKTVPVIFWLGDIGWLACAQGLAIESLGACLKVPVPVCDPTEPASSIALNGAIVTACMMFKMLRGPYFQRMSFKRGKLNDLKERIFTSSYCTLHKDMQKRLGSILQGLQRLPNSDSHPFLPWEARLKSKSK